MRKCPNCSEKAIPVKWILLGKAHGQEGRCFQCEKCGEKIKKMRIFGLLENLLYSEIGWILLFILIALYSTLLHSFFTSFVFALMTIVFLHIIINSIVVLQVADKGYCEGEMTKIEAFFGLIIMATLILFMVNFFIIQPFFR